MNDFELLQSYASRASEDVFRSLAERYVNLVYSAAVRQTGNAEAAKDVTQAVFLTLAAKAGTISHQTVLAGWLLRTTRFAAANARRLEQRRQHYEQQAMESYVQSTGIEADWQRIAPLLDEALDGLAEKDRDAVVLRFFDQMPLKRLAEKLGVSEDGAQKRVSRALDKLRLFFARHGRTLSVGALTSALSANGVQAAPAALATSVCAAAAGSGALSGSFVTAVAHATLRAIAQAKLRLFAIRAGSAAMFAGLVALLVFPSGEPSARNKQVAAIPAMTVPAPEPLAPQAEPAVVPAAIAAPRNVAELRLRVLDAQTAAPVTNARLTLISITELAQRTTNTFTTDANGAARVTYSTVPVPFWSQCIEVFRDGYVPKFVSWSEFQQDRMDEIPADYTLRFDPAVTIGGVVVDEQGAAVPDARVVFSRSGPTSSRARERLTMMGNYHSEITGADGRWSCHHVPARFGMIEFKPAHPLFQEKRWITDSPDAPAYVNVDQIPQADFLAGQALMRLESGLAIAGVVTDESGQPVVGARVTQDFDFHNPERSLPTEADGSFHFRNGRPGNLSLTVQAANFAPVVTSMVFNASLENLHVILPAGRALRGRVVDDADNPVAGATVEPASPTSDSRTLFQWHAKTDAEGRFAWDAAPAVQEYAVYADGYETELHLKLNADTTEETIRLTRKSAPSAARILGQVVDAGTKQPPPSVRVQIWETRKEPGGGFSSSTTLPEDADTHGKFRLKTSSGTVSYVLEAQADGYWPQRLTNQVTGEREVILHIELAKAAPAAGVVLTPAGEPAAGATLVVCGHHEFALMNQPGKLVTELRGSGLASAVADGQGRFRLPNKLRPEVVVVAHARGVGEIPFSQMTSNTVITLQPWGRIAGTLRSGARPLARAGIRLNRMPWRMGPSAHVSVLLDAPTDAEGNFTFATVPPGEWVVARELNQLPEGKAGVRFPVYSHGVPVVVGAGETAAVTLGGEGRTIVGRAVAPNSLTADVWMENSVALILKVPTPNAPLPPKLAGFSSGNDFQAANATYAEQSLAYWNSDTGLSQQRLQREYRAMFAADGSFRVADVPPGEYTVKVNLVKLPTLSEGNSPNFAPIASLETDATIPAVSGPSDDSPVSLGVIQLLDRSAP